MVVCFCVYLLSHPTWVRELKYHSRQRLYYGIGSHPTWMRELKLQYDRSQMRGARVAPFVGA